MSTTPSTQMEIETGQINERNEILSENDHMEEQEVNKSDMGSDNNTIHKKPDAKVCFSR